MSTGRTWELTLSVPVLRRGVVELGDHEIRVFRINCIPVRAMTRAEVTNGKFAQTSAGWFLKETVATSDPKVLWKELFLTNINISLDNNMRDGNPENPNDFVLAPWSRRVDTFIEALYLFGDITNHQRTMMKKDRMDLYLKKQSTHEVEKAQENIEDAVLRGLVKTSDLRSIATRLDRRFKSFKKVEG